VGHSSQMCGRCETSAENYRSHASKVLPAATNKADSRLRSLVAYITFLHGLTSENSLSKFVSEVFAIDKQPSYSFPDPSLALTSTLGGLFLPFLASSPNSKNSSSLLESGHYALFHSILLANDPPAPDLPPFLTLLEKTDKTQLVQVLYFIFQHLALAKDKLSLPTANDLWSSTSGIREQEYLGFTSPCWVILYKVLSCKFPSSDDSSLVPFPLHSWHF